MSSRVSLIATGESLLNYLNTRLSAGVFLEHLEESNHLYARLENNCGVPDIVILGLSVQEPIRTAEHILAVRKGIRIILFCKGDQQQTLQKSIQFSPFLNSDVISFEYKDKAIFLNTLQELVNNIEKQRIYETTIAEAERERTAVSQVRPLVANYLDKLLDRVPIGILNLDSKGRILNLNRSAQSLLGWSERDLVRMDLQMLFPSKGAEKIESLINEALHDDKRNNSQIVSLSRKDKKCYLEISISVLSINTSETILTVILQEVTDKVLEERKRKKAEKAREESERQLRLVIDSIPDLIAYVDADITYQFNNKAYEKRFGFAADEIKGKKIWEVIGEQPYEVIKRYVDIVMSGRTITFEEKMNNSYLGGSYIRSTYVPNFSRDGDVCGFFVLTSDITQSKNAEEIEKKHMLELAHTSRIITIGEMSTQLAHELSQPLTSIETYSRACITLINKGRFNIDEIKNTFENISNQARRAQEVMHELRNFVKKDASRKNLSINSLIKSAIKLLQIEFQEYDLDIELDLREQLPNVIADRILIEQVLINLVKNALEAMQDVNKSDRSLRLQSDLLAGEGVMVSVRDSGPGLSEYEISKIFEPFYTTKPEGMGMGLAITRSIIDSHSGDLEVVTNVTGGTTFQFTLPIAQSG